MTAFKHPTYSHLKDDYWTTTAPAPVGYVPDGQFVDDETNVSQGDIGSVPNVVEPEPAPKTSKK